MIRILVDSAADCGAENPNISGTVPLTVSIDGRDYRDGVDLTADRFYQLLTSDQAFPKTSQPSPEAFARYFEEAKAAGDTVLCFTISSTLSGTHQSAVIGADMAEFEDVYIIDTKAVTHLIGILADYAAGQIRQGVAVQQIAENCLQLKNRLRVYAGLETLEYLHKGGRLSRTSAAVGQLAGIKPIVCLNEEGAVAMAAKTIGVARAIGTILNKLSAAPPDPDFPLYTLYTQGEENVEALEKKLTAAGYRVAGRRQIGPTIGAHVGPGVYGVAYVTEL